MQAALSDGNSSSRRSGLKSKLADHWSKLASLVRHDEQTKISFQGDILRRMFSASQCFQAGLCVCRAAPTQNLHASWLHAKLVRLLKQEMWSKGQGKERQTSAARSLAEQGHLVLALRPRNEPESQPAADVFMHVGFMHNLPAG